jgi:hypothetical protein
MIGIGSRISFGVMTGHAYIDAKASCSDLNDGKVFGERILVLIRLQGNVNRQLIACHGHITAHTKVRPPQHDVGVEACRHFAVSVGEDFVDGRVQNHGFRDAMHGKVATDLKRIVVYNFYLGTGEGNRRETRYREEL